MIGKNNHKLFMEKGANKYKRYTLKKLSVGVVSVSIGFGLMFGSVEGVSADELTGTNSVVEPNNIDSVQSNEEVSAESNVDKSSETVQSDSSEQIATIDQSLEMKRQEVKTVLGESNIVGEQYTDLVIKIANAQTLDELEGILVEIKQTASLEDNQDLTEQSETEHDAGEKLKNHSEEKDEELDKITTPSTETNLSKESSVENLVRVGQLNVTSDVKYTLNDVRHLLNSADIARIESGELTVQQTIEKLLNNKVELRETEARHENGVLAAGVEKSSLSPDKQRGKSRSRRSLNGVDVESLFRLFTEQDTVRDVYNRIQQMRQANLIAETEFHFLQIEVLRHLRNGIANNEQDSNSLTPKNAKSKLPNDERILNMHLSNQEQVTVPLSHLSEKPFRRIDHQVKKELEYVNEFLKEIEKMVLTRFGNNDEGIYFSSDEYDNQAVTYASHKTRKTFHVPEIRTNADGTVTLKMSSESEGGVELKSHYAFSFNLSHELNERVKEEQLVRGLYRPEKGQQSDENGDKLQNQVSSPLYEVNEYSPQNGAYPGYVGYYISQWSEEEGYHRKKDRFAKIELTFEANNQKITDAKLSSGILSNSFNYRHRPGTSVASQAFNEQAEELKTLLNLMTEYNQLKNKITGTKQEINEFNQSLGEETRVLSQRDYDNLKAKHQTLKQKIEQIKTDYTTLTNKAMYSRLHQQVKADIDASKSVIEKRLNDLYPVNDLNNNGKKDTEDITFAEQKVNGAKDKKITLLSKVNELNGKTDISQEEYLEAVSLSNQFKTAIEDARLAIGEIPESDIISALGISYRSKRVQLENDLPQNNVQLPAAPTTATQTSSDPNEKNSITNPTLINGDFSDLTLGAVVGSADNGPDSVPGWTVVNSSQTKIPLVNRRSTNFGNQGHPQDKNHDSTRNNGVILGASDNAFYSSNNKTGIVNVNEIGGIYQELAVTPGSELVLKYRSDSSGAYRGSDPGFDGADHAVAQAQAVVTRVDTGEILMTLLPGKRLGYGEAVGVVSIPNDVNRVRITLSHKSQRVHNASKGILSKEGWYPGAVVSDVRVSSGSHVTTEIVNQSQTYTSPNNTSSPYNGTVQLRFHNHGHEKANATFTMRLPEGVTYRSVSNGSGSYDEQSRTLTVTKNGIPAKIPNQDTYTTVDINLMFDTSAPRTFEIETQNVTYITSPDRLTNDSTTRKNVNLGNVGSYSVTVAMYTSELQTMVNEYQDTIGSFKYYNAADNLKSGYDSAIEEGRQILGNTQSTQQAINDIANRIGIAKNALNGEATNKDALEAAIKVAEITTADPFYSRLQDIDSNLKSEYGQAVVEAQRILGNQNATQEEVKQATDKLSLQEIKVALKKYEESIKTYQKSYNQLPKLDNDQIFVTGKANRQLAKLWSEIDKFRISAWNKVYQNNIKQNLQADFFKIDMKRRKLVEVPDKTEVSIPTEKISVHDLGADLSQKEKDIIKKAIEDSNNFLSGTKVEISDNGTATITFPDHTGSEPSQETINRDDLIRELTPEEKQLLLEKQKAEALSDIDRLIDLSDDERQTFKDKVAEADTADKIVDILAEASGLSFNKLVEAKATLRDKIETLVEDEEQKETFLAEIDAAEQLEDIQAIEDLVDTYLSVEDESDVEEAKATLRDKIETLVEDEEQKETFLAEIDAAEQLEDIQAIEDLVDTYLGVEDESDVEEAKATLRDKIETLVEDEEQKETFLAEIDAAEQLEDVQAIEDLVDTYLGVEDESDVEEAKATLRDKIETLVEDEEQKETFLAEIDAAEQLEDIQAIEDLVDTYLGVEDESDVEEAKATLRDKIETLVEDEEQKETFLAEIDAAEQLEDVQAIEDLVDTYLGVEDESDVEEAKATLRDKIETLVEDEEQKETFLAEIDAAEQLEDVQAIEDLVDTYLGVEDESDVEEAKATLRDKIETLVEDEEQKETFLAEIDAAEQLEDVQAIEDLVDTYLGVEDESDVEEAKATLRDKIETLVEDEEQKETFLAEIDAAEQLEDVQAIEDLVDTYLGVEDESDVEEAKATLRDKIETLVEDEEQKETFLAEIDAAEQLEDVQAIEDLVDTYLGVEDESDVEEAKATLRDKIETLVEDEEQKETFLAEIDAAEQLEDVQAIEDLVDTYLGVEDESDVEEAKATLRDKIETLVEDEEQKETFLAEIDAAEQLEDVQAIEDLVDTYLGVEDESDVEEAKATLRDKIETLVEDEEQKETFLAEIDAAEQLEDIQAIEDLVDTYLSVEDESDVEEAKATLRDKIETLVEDEEQKETFLAEIDAAEQLEDIQAIEDLVDTYLSVEDESDVEEAKATLRDKIETLVEDEEQKETFLAEIDAAEQLEDIQAIEDLVDTYLGVEDESDVEEAKATLRDKIETLVEDEEQKETFLAEIDAAEQLEDVQAIEDLVDTYLGVEDESDVEEAKATLRDKIETLVEDEEQKETFLAEIDAAEQLEDVQAIEDLVDTYLGVEDESDVEEAKATLRDKIETLVEDEEQKETFLAEIDAAEQLEDVQAIEDLVDTYLGVEDESDVEEAKATLRDKIETLVEDEEQKETFLAEIDVAEQLEDVQAIEDLVDTYLGVEDESDVEEAKATLRDKIETLVEDEEQKETFLAEIDVAEQLEDVQAIEDLVDTYLGVEDESDVEEAKATLTTKIGAVISEDAKKVEFLQEVDTAETEEALAAIEAKVDAEADEADEAELTEAKATLEAKVDAVVESSNQKAAFKEAIKDATTIEELSVVDDNVNSYLSALDHEALEAAKATLTTKIGAVISEDAKKVEFLQEVDTAETEEALAAIEAKVDAEADEADEAELTEAKATLEAKVDAVVESSNQKAAFKEAIKDATTIEELSVVDDNVNSYLSALDHEALEAAKATLTTKIGAVISEDAKKVEFLQEVDTAETEEALAAIEAKVDAEADEADEAELTEAKATLEAKVDAVVESANQKAAFKEAIKDATTIEELSVVDDNVNSYLSALDHEALEAAKATLTTKIGAVISEDAKKVEFLQEVDTAETEEALAAIEAKVDAEADEADEAELTEAKATLEAKVDAVVESANQKAAFKEAIKDATTIEELSVVDDNVNSYLSALDHEALEAAKATLTTKIGAVISEDAKKVEFLQEVDTAETEEALAAIEAKVDAEADEADEAELTEAKATLEAKVDAVVESANQKAAFKEAIKDATTIEELSVVDDNVNSYLSALDHEALEAAKATLTTKIGAVISEDAKKVEFLQEVDTAETEEALAAIEAKVDAEADEADEAELTEAKATLEAKVDAVVESANQKAAFKEAIKDATTIEELSVVDDNVNSYLSALDHEALEAAKATLTTKIGAVISEDAKKVEFLQEVDTAETEEALAAIEAKVDAEADEADEAELTEAKATLEAKVDAVVESANQKAAFKEAIKDATTIEELSVVDDNVNSYLSALDHEALEAAKATLTTKIGAVISEDAKKVEFLQEVDTAETEEALAAIEAKVDAEADEADEAELTEAKATLEAKVDAVVESSNQKAAFKEAIKDATTIEELSVVDDNVNSYLSALDHEALEAAKATLTTKIGAVISEDAKKVEFLQEVDTAETEEALAAIEAKVDAEADEADEAELTEAKATLEAKVDAVVESSNQKAAFKEAIKDATTIEELSVVDDNVNSYLSALDHEALEAAKATLTTKIGAVISEDAKKVEFLQEVDTAETEEALAAIEAKVDAEADEADEAELTEAKATLEAKVDAVVESANQKAAFKEAIKDATTIEELSVVDDNVNSYLSALDHEALEAAKATLTTKIGAVISEDAKKVEFLQEVDTAETEEALAAIEAKVDAEADEADEAELTEAKATLEAKVDAVVESANQKAAFKEAIKDATTIEELSVVDDNVNSYLSALDHEALEAAKATLTTKIGAVISEDAKKVEFLQEVDTAETEEALAAIEAKVDAEADEADEAELTEAKATLEAKVDAVVESANQKAAFKEAIKDATTIEELSVVDDNVNSYLSALDHEALEAAKATLTTKIGAVISEDAKKVEFLQEVDTAETEEALAAIEAKVDAEADEADEAELTEAKATLEAKVDAVVESANQKAAFKEAIKDATTIEELSVVDDNVNSYLSALDHEALEAAKATLTTKIGAVISEDAKKVEFLQEVDTAETEEALAAIEAKVDAEADEADEAELTEAKATLEAKVDAVVESSNQKAAFKEAIKDATTIEELSVVDDNVNSYLSALDHEALEAAKATLTTKIGAVISEDAKKVEFLQEVDTAETEEALAAIEAKVDAEADEADEAELTEAKATLEAKVDAVVESSNQKAAFKEAIKDATTIEELSVVDDNVNSYLSALDHEALEAAKATLTTKIGAVISEDAKKVEFLQEVDTAETEEALAAIEAKVDAEADEADEAELTEAKATLEAKVDAVVESANQKAAFKEAIKDATTIEELSVVDDNVNSYLSALDHEALEAAKATLTTKIGAVISEDAKKVEFLQEVDTAETEEALAAIEAKVDAEADEADEAELTEAKATLEAKVDAVVESANQKAAFKEAIKDATTIEELSVVDDNVNSYLSALDHEALEAAKATLTTKIGAVISEDAKKVEFLQEVDTAETEEALAAIEAKVDAEADEADEAELTEAKATLEAKVDAVVESANQKAAFKEAIKDATTIEELSVVDDNVNSYLSALDHEALEAAKATLTTKIGAVISEDAKKVEFLQEVDTAETEEALAAIEAKVDAEAKLAPSAPESGNGAGTVQPEMPEFDGGTHGLGLINEKPAFPAEELGRLLQVERDKASAYVGTLSNLDTSKVTEFQQAIQQAQTVPAIEAISQTAEALNAKLAPSAPESGNGAGTVQPEMPEFDGGTHGLGLINEKSAFPAEELGRLLQVERDKASAYVGTLSNLDASKVTEYQQAIQQAQTVPAIEAISQTAEALNAKLALSAPESGNDEGTVQPEKPEFGGGTHGLGLINEKPAFPAEELARLLQVERDKASAYVATLSNLDASKVTEFQQAIQQAQTVPAIEAISQTAEALNAKLAPSAPGSGNGEGTVQPEKPEFNGGTHGLGLINEKPAFPAEELEQGKVGDEQEQSTEPKAPTQPGQDAPESEHPVDKPAVTDQLQKVKTQVNGQQSIQESTKQEKSGERLPDTATISWLLGMTGISTLLAGLGLKKKREDDDK